jgi:hypothetical protein
VAESPSTAFGAGQQVPEEEAVTGLPCDSSTAAAGTGAAAGAGAAVPGAAPANSPAAVSADTAAAVGSSRLRRPSAGRRLLLRATIQTSGLSTLIPIQGRRAERRHREV